MTDPSTLVSACASLNADAILKHIAAPVSGKEENGTPKTTTSLKRPASSSDDTSEVRFSKAVLASDWRRALSGLLAFGLEFLEAQGQSSDLLVAPDICRKIVRFIVRIGCPICVHLRQACRSSSDSRNGSGFLSTESGSLSTDRLENLAEFYRQEFSRIPNQSEDLSVHADLCVMLVKEMLWLYRKLGKEDLSRFVLENLCHPYKKLQKLTVSLKKKPSRDFPNEEQHEQAGGSSSSTNRPTCVTTGSVSICGGVLAQEEEEEEKPKLPADAVESPASTAPAAPKTTIKGAKPKPQATPVSTLPPEPNLYYLSPEISFPFAVEWGRVRFTQNRVRDAESKLAFALQYFAHAHDLGPSNAEAKPRPLDLARSSAVEDKSAQRQLRVLLRMYIPARLACGRAFEPEAISTSSGETPSSTTTSSATASTSRSGKNARSFEADYQACLDAVDKPTLNELRRHYAAFATAVGNGDLQAFDSCVATSREFFYRQKVDVQLLTSGRKLCWWNLCRQTYYLVKNAPSLAGSAGALTIASGKGIKLEAFDVAFKVNDPKLFDEDVISILAELTAQRALRCYITWERQGIVFDDKKPFATIEEWLK